MTKTRRADVAVGRHRQTPTVPMQPSISLPATHSTYRWASQCGLPRRGELAFWRVRTIAMIEHNQSAAISRDPRGNAHSQYRLESATDADHVPCVRIKMCRPFSRAFPERVWQFDRRLTTGSQLEPPGEAEVSNVSPPETRLFVQRGGVWGRS